MSGVARYEEQGASCRDDGDGGSLEMGGLKIRTILHDGNAENFFGTWLLLSALGRIFPFAIAR